MRLVNCTGSPVSVLVDGSPHPLPEQPYPVAYGSDVLGELLVEVGQGSCTLRVESPPSEATLYLPERAEGVLYLVEPEVLMRFPDRDDFVSPAAFGSVPGDDEADLVLVSVNRDLPPLSEVPNTSRASVEARLEAVFAQDA